MNTLDYSYLVKDMKLHKKVESMQKTKNIMFWLILPLCFVIFLSNSYENIFVYVLNIIFLAIIIIELLFNIYFYKFIDKNRKMQIFSIDEDIDKTFIKLNDNYTIHFAIVKKLIWISIVAATILLLTIIGLFIVGENIESDLIFAIASLGLVIFFVAIISCTVIISFKQISFAKKSMNEIEQIKQYFYEQEGLTPEEIAKKKRKIFTNVADSQKVLAYMYPDEEIRNKVQKMVFVIMIPIIIIGALAGGIGSVATMNEDLTLLCVALAIGVVGSAVGILVYVTCINRLIKKQRAIFENNLEKYKYHCELADETKTYQKKNNIHTLIITIVILIFAIVLGFIIPKTVYELGGLIFMFLIIWLIAVMAIFIPSYKKYRAKAKLIEQKIDEHEKQFKINEA